MKITWRDGASDPRSSLFVSWDAAAAVQLGSGWARSWLGETWTKKTGHDHILLLCWWRWGIAQRWGWPPQMLGTSAGASDVTAGLSISHSHFVVTAAGYFLPLPFAAPYGTSQDLWVSALFMQCLLFGIVSPRTLGTHGRDPMLQGSFGIWGKLEWCCSLPCRDY